MRDSEIDLCGAEGGGRAPDMPYLAAEDRFAFRCAGCGGCCRGREDIVLSGYDLYRLSRRLGLPPKTDRPGFLPPLYRDGQPSAGAAAGAGL